MRAPFSRNLFDLICEQAARYGERTAVIFGEARVTYRELEHRASAIASGLRAAGVRKGDRVGLLVTNRPEWIDICFGAAAIGATVVPFSTWSKRRELEFLLADAKVRALFLVDRFGHQDYIAEMGTTIAEARLPLVVRLGESPLAGAIPYAAFITQHAPFEGPYPPGDAARTQDDALILYTSGSTASPKAVPLAHGPIIENAFNIGERQGLGPDDVVLLLSPLFWSYGSVNAMCATLTHGATLVLQERFEPGEAIDLIERHGCSSIYTLPAITAALIGHASFRPERTRILRTGLTIGTPQDVQVAAEVLGAREICNVYGQTESYGNCCVTWHHWPLERRKTAQGPPLPGVTVRIVDPETGRSLGRGEVGSIEVKGNLTRGYDGVSQEQNEQAFTPDGFFRTGDLGRITLENDVQFVARSSEMIKRAGINIAPAEIESLLRQHPDVAEAGVAGFPDPEKGEIVVAFVVAATGAAVDADALKAHCRTLASSYKTPDRIEFRDALPLTTTGKLMRQALKQMAASLSDLEGVK